MQLNYSIKLIAEDVKVHSAASCEGTTWLSNVERIKIRDENIKKWVLLSLDPPSMKQRKDVLITMAKKFSIILDEPISKIEIVDIITGNLCICIK